MEAAELAAHPVVAEALERCAFPDSSPLCCAVSGGADSAALLILAVATGQTVWAIHVDHGLRPESGADAAAVVELGARFDVEVDVLVDICVSIDICILVIVGIDILVGVAVLILV